MIAWFLWMSIVIMILVLFHRRSRLEKKVFKNVPLVDWLSVTAYPFLVFIGWAGMIRQVFLRPSIGIMPWEDFEIFIIMMFFFIYTFVGSGIHFTSKILWRYLSKGSHDAMVYKVNEMFHNKISHYFVYVSVILVLLLMAFAEVNHPLSKALDIGGILFIVVLASVFGIFSAKSILYSNQWFGGYNKPISTLVFIMTLSVYVLFRSLHLSFSFYPLSLFVLTVGIACLTTFLLRLVFVFSRLSQKNRLKFLHRFLSV